MSQPNARAIGSMLERLKEEAEKGDSAATKPLPKHGNAKKPSTSGIKPTCTTEANSLAITQPTVDGDESMHPKAVGSLLKMMQTEKGRFYEKPSEQTTMPSFPDRIAKDAPKTKTEKKKDCFCSLCQVNCTSQIVLDTHLAGKKHKKNVEKLKRVTKAFSPSESIMTNQPHRQQGMVADIQGGFNVMAYSEPLVGLEYITEYQKPDSCHRYFCETCELKSNYEEMLEHVISRQHRLRFMRTHCFDIYYRVTGYPNFKNIMLPSDADKLLKQHSGFVIRRLLKGKLRLCKVKQYKGEEGMAANLQNYQGIGKVHPARYKDLPKAEKLFEEEEAREKEERAIQRQELMEKRKNDQDIFKSLNSYHRQSFNKAYMPLADDFTENHSLETELMFDRDPDLLEVRQLEDEVLRSRLREERLVEQEHRIVIALRKLREGSVGGEMTREEAIAGKKLTLLLKTIRGEKNRDELMQKRGGLAMKTRELSTGEPPSHQGASVIKPLHASSLCADTVDLFSRKNLATEQNDACLAREMTQSQNDDALSEFRKTVAPIIEKTRLQVEEKIFQALSGGTLSSLIDTLKNNPKLQASLKQWEQQQSANVDDSHTKQVPASDLNNDTHPSTLVVHFESTDSDVARVHGSDFQNDSHPSTRGRHFESFDSNLHGSDFQNDSRPGTSRDNFESINSIPTKAYTSDYQKDSVPSTRDRHFESFDSDLALVHGSHFQNDSQPSTSRDHFESMKSKPAKACRSDYQNNFHPDTRGERFESLSSRLQLLAGGDFLTGDGDKPGLKEHSSPKHMMPRRRPLPNHMSLEGPPIPKRPMQTVPECMLPISFSLPDTSIYDRGDPKGNTEWNEKGDFRYCDYNHQTVFGDGHDDFDGAGFCSDTTSRLYMKPEHSGYNRQTGLLDTVSTLEMSVSKSLSRVETKKLSSGLLGSRPQFSGCSSNSKFHSGFY